MLTWQVCAGVLKGLSLSPGKTHSAFPDEWSLRKTQEGSFTSLLEDLLRSKWKICTKLSWTWYCHKLKKEDSRGLDDLRSLLKRVSLSNLPIWGMPFSEPQQWFTYLFTNLFEMCGCQCACWYIGVKCSSTCVCSHMCGCQRAPLGCSLDSSYLVFEDRIFPCPEAHQVG